MNSIEKANVDLIELAGGKRCYLVGAAHISQASADLAEEVIRSVHPDAVAVELCDSRYQSMRNPEQWRKMDIVAVIRQGKAYLLLSQLILSGFQKKIGKELHIKPGAEMMRAMDVAQELGVPTVLADREIKITLKRTWSALSLWSTFKMIFAMSMSIFTTQKISVEEIERLKSSDALESMMAELARELPEVRSALIDERDQYMAAKIQSATGNTIVAIVGAGHVPGIKQYLHSTIDTAALEQIPVKRLSRKIISWSIPAMILGMMVYGFFTAGGKVSMGMIESWAIATGVFAGLGAVAALAHPLSIVSAVVSAPITSLHPLLAAGWVAGLVEAFVRRPVVKDFETLPEDVQTVRGFFSNRLSRILLIVAFTNIGCTIGVMIGIPLVASWL